MPVHSSKLIIFMMTLAILTSPLLAPAEETLPKTNVSRPSRPHPYGGTLFWGTSNPPPIINPVLTQHSVSASIIPLIFDGLVRINSEEQIEPCLAKSWDISDDNLVYTFYLQKGVKFHDGVELTAEDVKFTYDRIEDPKVESAY